VLDRPLPALPPLVSGDCSFVRLLRLSWLRVVTALRLSVSVAWSPFGVKVLARARPRASTVLLTRAIAPQV